MIKKTRKKTLKRVFSILIILSIGYVCSNLGHLDLDFETFFSKSIILEQPNNSIELEQVTLKRVVDGDTIVVLDDNEKEVRVRMIGVDTPESVHVDESKNSEDGKVASEYTKSQLIAGQILFLEYDKERLDQFGRTLAYVWLVDNVDPTDINDIQAKMYNAKLVIEGYAVAKTYQPNTKYAAIFKSLEN